MEVIISIKRDTPVKNIKRILMCITAMKLFGVDNYVISHPDFGSCSSCGGEVEFGKMAEHTCPDEKGKE